jgi:hypothetical protein
MRIKYDLGLEESIICEEIINISSDLLEIGFDNLINEGIIKDIPFLNTVYNVVKTGLNIRDRIFLKKMIRLLYNTKEVPVVQRIKIINRINSEKKYRFKIGEKLIFILDRADEIEKVDYISHLFVAFLNEEISYYEFLKASDAINRCFLGDLEWFFESYHQYNSSEQESYGLFSAGILQIKMNNKTIQTTKLFAETHLKFELSSIGKVLDKKFGNMEERLLRIE